MTKLTHLDDAGAARMVDVSAKPDTHRVAVTAGSIRMLPETLKLIEQGASKKGDVLGIARIAGIQAAKRASDLIPLCHPLMLSKVDVELELNHDESCVDIRCTAKTTGPTGVEMEALTGATVAALTIYDMCKAVDRGMQINQVRLLEKSGGKSGHWKAE